MTKDDPPTLILHGSIDSTVPIDQAELLVEKLEKAGVTCEYDRVEGWPHTMDLEAGVNRHCMAKMFEFFDEHLGAPSKDSEQVKLKGCARSATCRTISPLPEGTR